LAIPSYEGGSPYRDTDPPQEIGITAPKQQNAPHEGEAFSLQRRIQQVRGERRITLR